MSRRLYTLGPDAKKPSLLRAMNRRLYTLGPDAVALALLAAALRTYLQTGRLPPLPAASTANG